MIALFAREMSWRIFFVKSIKNPYYIFNVIYKDVSEEQKDSELFDRLLRRQVLYT
jgi:hypothetical protein